MREIKDIKNRLFADEYVNTARQKELDLLKGVAIVFMAIAHLIGMHEDYIRMTPAAEKIIYVLETVIAGPFGATTFMVCMGVGIWYSAYNKGNREELLQGIIPSGLAKRGVLIFILGVLINLVTCITLPLIGYIATGDAELIGYMERFFDSDIYHFAGLALLTMALIRKLKLKDTAMIPIALGFSCMGWLLRGLSTGIFAIDRTTLYFWGSDPNAWFPLFNWFFFPVAGYFFAKLLARCKDKKLLYSIISPAGAVVIGVYIFICIKFNIGFAGLDDRYGYYWCTPIDAFCYLGAVALLFGLAYMITEIFKEKEFRIIRRWGKNLMWMYTVHWILVAMTLGIETVIGIEEIPFWSIFVMALLVTIATDGIVVFFKNKVSKRKDKVSEEKNEKV